MSSTQGIGNLLYFCTLIIVSFHGPSTTFWSWVVGRSGDGYRWLDVDADILFTLRHPPRCPLIQCHQGLHILSASLDKLTGINISTDLSTIPCCCFWRWGGDMSSSSSSNPLPPQPSTSSTFTTSPGLRTPGLLQTPGLLTTPGLEEELLSDPQGLKTAEEDTEEQEEEDEEEEWWLEGEVLTVRDDVVESGAPWGVATYVWCW